MTSADAPFGIFTCAAVNCRSESRVTCAAGAVKALFVPGCSGPKVLVKVERPQRSEDVRP
jgi:hypothetical protein